MIDVGSDDVDKRLFHHSGMFSPVESVRQNDVSSSYPWQTNKRNKQGTYICILFTVYSMHFALAS